MKNINSKKKYNILKSLGFILDFAILFLLTSIGVLIGLDNLWEGIKEDGFTSFIQWFSLISYRLILYLSPALILSIFKFDKRYKFVSRLKIWLNWTSGIFLVTKAFIAVFELDTLLGIKIFEKIDFVVLLIGYVITFATKEKVEFGSTEAIIDPKSINKN